MISDNCLVRHLGDSGCVKLPQIVLVCLCGKIYTCTCTDDRNTTLCMHSLSIVNLCSSEVSFVDGTSLTICLLDMIRRLADMANTQFITTTFRSELVKVADKIYGVTHKNRVSRVNVVSKEDALDFIEHDQSHNAE